MQYLSLTLQFIGKAVSAALFGILLLIAFALTAPMGSHEYMGFYRYDYLLIYALIIQIGMGIMNQTFFAMYLFEFKEIMSWLLLQLNGQLTITSCV